MSIDSKTLPESPQGPETHIAEANAWLEMFGGLENAVEADASPASGPQSLLLPRSMPALDGFEVAGVCHTAHGVGGDFYDVLTTGRRTWLMIADVMGKGVAAALVAATVRGLSRMLARMDSTPSTLLRHVNEALFDELAPTGTFVTAQAVLLDRQNNLLRIASAGHCPLLAASKAGTCSVLSPEGTPLGIFPDAIFSEASVQLDLVQSVLLHTDGVTDTQSPRGDRFGFGRLNQWFLRCLLPPCPALEMKQALVSELEMFQAGQSLLDDRTFLVLSRA